MSSKTPSTFGPEVKRLREHRGISQTDLAKKVSCSVDTIRKIENNLSYRTSEALAEKLAHALGIVGAEEVVTFVVLARTTSAKPGVERPLEDKTDHAFDEASQGLECNDGIFVGRTTISTQTADEKPFAQEAVAARLTERPKISLTVACRFKMLLIAVTVILVMTGSILVLQWRSYRAITYLRGPIPLTSPTSSNELNPALGWQKGRSLDSTYVLNPTTGSLKLTAGGQTIFAKEGDTAPMIILPVQGDFTAQVMATFRPGSACCKHAGMGMRAADNEGDWIRISKDHADTIQVDGLLDGYSTNSFVSGYMSDRVWFKIERRDNQITMSYSGDGVNWISIRKDYIFDISGNVQLLLFAYSAFNSDSVSVEFSHFIVE